VFSTNVVESIVERTACACIINDEYHYCEIIQPENPTAILFMHISKIAHNEVDTPSDSLTNELMQVAKAFAIVVVSCSLTHGLNGSYNRIAYIGKE
jgi:hypothetical protein